MFCLFFLVAGVSVHSDLLWLLCPFGVGCQLSGSQGGGISDSASRGKGDFPFPHEDRRDVTLWRLYVFFACRGFRKPPGPLFTPPAPSEGGRGRRKAAQGLCFSRRCGGFGKNDYFCRHNTKTLLWVSWHS